MDKQRRFYKGIMRIMLSTLVVFSVCFFSFSIRGYAAPTDPPGGTPQNEASDADQGEDHTDDGADDIEKETLTKSEGSATIIEYEKNDEKNHVTELLDTSNLVTETEKDLTFENDLPSVTETNTYADTSGEADSVHAGQYKIKDGATPTETSYTLTESGEEIELDAADKKIFEDVEATVSKTEDGYTSVKETDSQNAIQKAIDKALSSMTDGAKSLTIAVEDGDYNGDITINGANVKSGVTLSDDFKLYILASDSFDALKKAGESEIIDKSDENIQTVSAGNVKVNGNINIEGLDVYLAGIYLSLENKVTVKNGKLTYKGTTENDNINLIMEGENAQTVIIETGDGNDTVLASMEIADTAASTESSLSIHTGIGGDDISLTSDDETNDNHKVRVSLQAADTEADEEDGEDIIRLDISIAKKVLNQAIDLNTGKGYDSLILYGSLYDGTDETKKNEVVPSYCEDDPSKLSGYTITVYEKDGNKLEIKTDTENLSDYLENKPEVNVREQDFAADGSCTLDGAFTNYKLSSDVINNHSKINFSGNNTPYFSKLIIDGDKIDIQELLAGKFDIEITGTQIKISKKLEGKNISIIAYDGDDNAFADGLGTVTDTVNKLGLDVDVDFGTISFARKATINIEETATVSASGSVVMSAETSQTKQIGSLMYRQLLR